MCDKVWHTDVLTVAWQEERGISGDAGVDGETVEHVESYGMNHRPFDRS